MARFRACNQCLIGMKRSLNRSYALWNRSSFWRQLHSSFAVQGKLGDVVVRSACGRYSFQTGKIAPLTRKSLIAPDSETIVLATVAVAEEVSTTASVENREEIEELQLTVDYREFSSAAGQIPQTITRRELRQKDREILTCRIIDRAIRPLFPKSFYIDKRLQITCSTLAFDGVGDLQLLAINAALTALGSCDKKDVPWGGQLAAVRIVMQEDRKILANPTFQSGITQNLLSQNAAQESAFILDMLVIGMADKIMSVDCRSSSDSICSADIEKAFEYAELSLRERMILQRSFEQEYENFQTDQICSKEDPENGNSDRFHGLNSFDAGSKIRYDERSYGEIRKFEASSSFLPIVHGSSQVQFGETNVMSVATLGGRSSSLKVYPYVGQAFEKTFFVHHTFPPYALNKIGRIRENRLAIEEGNFIESAILPVLPSPHKFPCTLRMTTEVLNADGGSATASVCACSLALLDAGVNIKSSIGAVTVGLINTDSLVDITNLETSLSDAEMKIAATINGITALQIDAKFPLTRDRLVSGIDKGTNAIKQIVFKMNNVLSGPRSHSNLPKYEFIHIDPSATARVIGKGGETIRMIEATTGAKLTIIDDQLVEVFGESKESVDAAVEILNSILLEVKPGDEFKNVKVLHVQQSGAHIELLPQKHAWLHVSEISSSYLADATRILSTGDRIDVEVLRTDNRGIRVTMKSFEPEMMKPIIGTPSAQSKYRRTEPRKSRVKRSHASASKRSEQQKRNK